VRNAFNDELIAAISAAFVDIEATPAVRVVVVAARGAAFCAGADLHWMRAMANYSHAENQADALKVARMFQAVHACSRPVIARVQGDAFGGGVGLVAACDLAVSVDSAHFVLSEVKLGLVAATISPHLVRAMGARATARYMLTAERFEAARAHELGLIHEFASPTTLDAAVDAFTQALLAASPMALAASKRLLAELTHLPEGEELLATTARAIADARASSEGREGITAFLEKRAPGWIAR
jgi:methylglutaconyl-CoA hydratase